LGRVRVLLIECFNEPASSPCAAGTQQPCQRPATAPSEPQRKPPRPWCPAALAVAGATRELPEQERKVGEPRPGAAGHQLAAKSMAKMKPRRRRQRATEGGQVRRAEAEVPSWPQRKPPRPRCPAAREPLGPWGCRGGYWGFPKSSERLVFGAAIEMQGDLPAACRPPTGGRHAYHHHLPLPGCNARINAPLRMLGQRRPCPGCKTRLVVRPQPPQDSGPALVPAPLAARHKAG
jgi:hypothetical protein